MSAPVVVSVAPGSPAEQAGLQPGDEVLRLNGRVPRDVIEWRLWSDEPEVELVVARQGFEFDLAVAKAAGLPLGAEVSSAVFDRIRTCDNHCEFCFIYQLPKGMRRSLYLKDDDYRLSFLYGNFTTLTRFTEADLERVITEGLSPLHVSIHATDPAVRSQMLRNTRGATSLRWLRALLDHGIDVRGQIVVCPGVNDGRILDDTFAGILDEYPELSTLAVVPLGVSKFNPETAMRPHTTAEAAAVVDAVEDWQDVFAAALGRRLVHAADEYYLMAGRPFPTADRYDGFPMHEDGIGMARTFEREFTGAADQVTGVRSGFFAAVDGDGAATASAGPRNPTDYRTPCSSGPALVQLRPRRDAPVAILTGAMGAEVLRPLVASTGRPDVRVIPVANEFFGGNTGVAGLMVGADISRTLRAAEPAGHRYLVPDVCLSDDGRFLDGLTVADLPRAVEVIPTDGHLRAARRPGRRPCSRPEPNVTEASPTAPLPTVAVIGRPNVGKSTLFNRIIGEQAAIVEDRPGVTRDRKVLEAEWLGVPFNIVDTGGWMPSGSDLEAKVSRQVEAAVRDADVVLFVVDAAVGVTDDDEAIADWLRRGEHSGVERESDPAVIVVANKCDNDRREDERWGFMALGLGEPYPVSALHGRRAGDLLDVVVGAFAPEARRAPDDDLSSDAEPGQDAETDPDAPRVAIVGRPNVGKSTLFNRLVGEDRSVVHDLAGTTRDAIDTLVETEDGPIVFVDTAGMRRRSRIDDSAEYYSLVRALRAIDDADIALLVIDATEGVTGQDQRLAERVDAAGCPILVVFNKWELITDPEQRLDRLADLSRKLAFIGDAPVLKISALTGKGVHRLRPALQDAIEQYHRRVPTRDVNKVLADAQQRQPAGGGAKVMYAVQGATDPPTFTLFVNRELPQHYLRYLERSIREAFGFGSTPLKLRVRKRTS